MTNRFSCTVCTGTFDRPDLTPPPCAHGGTMIGVRLTESAPTGCFDQARFDKEVFARNNFVSSLGRGRFDCVYDQRKGVLDVTVKIDVGDGAVPEQQRRALAQRFQNRVPAYWDNKWVFRCTRAGWTALPPVTCRFHVDIVPARDSHFTLAFSQAKPSARPSTLPAYMRECRGFLSLNQVLTNNPQARDQLDLQDFHVDDFAHVLAAQIITQHERLRLQELLKLLWNTFPVPLVVRRENSDVTIAATVAALFMGYDGEITSLMAEKLRALARIAAMRVPGTRPVPIIIAPPGHPLAQGRENWDAEARLIVKFLKELPGGNDIQLGAPVPETTVLTVRIDEELEQAELKDLQYNVSTHEFGHLLGLPDEYENPETKPGAKPEDAAKALVKAAYLELVRLARLEPPVFPSHTSSMMSDGMTVLPWHAVTVWDALCAMTRPYLGPSDWAILPV